MKTTKTALRFFDVMDYEKEAEYLSDMHAHGWKFTYFNLPFFYHFVKCDPENVRYQLDYNKDGNANFNEYKQMFKDMGWEYMFDRAGYSYFRKPIAEGTEDEDIFCDDESRLDMMKRIFKGRIIPLIVIFFVIIVPYLAGSIIRFGGFIPAMIEGYYLWLIEGYYLWLILAVLYICVFVKYVLKYRAFKNRLTK